MGQLALEAPLLGLGNAGRLFVWVQVPVPEAAMTFKIASPAPFERPAEIAGPNSVRIEEEGERGIAGKEEGGALDGCAYAGRKASGIVASSSMRMTRRTTHLPCSPLTQASCQQCASQVDIRENRVLE